YDYSAYVYGYDVDELNVEEVLPRYTDSNGGEDLLVDCTDILYLPRERDLNYLITLAIPTADPEADFEAEVMMGYSENIYASTDNLYVASTNYDYGDFYYDPVNVKTLVHRFDLDTDGINFEASGKVPGTILNQFSMDEHEDHFRIATTINNWVDPETNNLYVLDMDLDQTGAVEGIAPNESIYSTRFMGDRGFMVTFEKIDPLFAFDLSDPNNPVLVGELKIPGYSDYLHPYDENHLIGFGKETEDPPAEQAALWGQNFSWYQGMKIAIFDVTNLTSPEEVFSVGIGDRGTESPLLYDHHALLFDAARDLLAFPVTVATVADENAPPETYGETTFQGAYVY
ncbi:MAG: beta-propeller domain-containing protein, partial [Patescibacteria group bacterium]